MACSCPQKSNDHEQLVNELLSSVGMKEIAEQGRGAIAEAGRALVQLNRAERATALGFGPEVAAVRAEAARRANQRAQQQARTVLSSIDHLTGTREWAAHVKRIRAAFVEREGARMLTDLRDDVRLLLLDDDPGLDATVAELTIAALDDAIRAASGGDLNKLVSHMRSVMQGALDGFESPQMGRQNIGLRTLGGDRPDTSSGGLPPIGGGADSGWCVALAACVAWAVSSLVFSLVACFATPFCWCCYHMAALATFALHLLICSVSLGPQCKTS